MNDFKKIICCSVILLCSGLSYAQKTKTPNISLVDTALLVHNKAGKVCVKDLIVTGTKKTKPYIVYREIQFKKNDSLLIADLYKEL